MKLRVKAVALGFAALFGVAVLAPGLGVLVPAAVPETPEGPAGSGIAAGVGPDEAVGARHRILVLSGPIHTDIALPATAEVREAYAFLSEAELPIGRQDVAHVVVGWGGRSFYLETPNWADVRPLPLFRSFTSDASVLHVELAAAIDEGAPSVRAIDLDAKAFASLMEAINASFSRDGAGSLVEIAGSGYGGFDRFFEAEGRFNALVGCNVWTGRMLRSAGIATGIWTPLPQTLLWSLDLHN